MIDTGYAGDWSIFLPAELLETRNCGTGLVSI